MHIYECPECGSHDLDGYVSGTFSGQIDADGNIEETQLESDYVEFTCQSCGKYFVPEED